LKLKASFLIPFVKFQQTENIIFNSIYEISTNRKLQKYIASSFTSRNIEILRQRNKIKTNYYHHYHYVQIMEIYAHQLPLCTFQQRFIETTSKEASFRSIFRRILLKRKVSNILVQKQVSL